MTNKEKIDTRDRILATANDLFASKGFDGTSVRDIAKAADVNLAAINYHFKNKQSLYAEVFKMNYEWMASGINKIGEDQTLNAAEFTYKVHQFFLENHQALLNTFKIFLNDNFEGLPEVLQDEDQPFGPPGQEAFLKVYTREVGKDIPFAGRHWAVRMIFGNIVHFAVSMCTNTIKTRCKDEPWMKPEEKKKSILLLVESTLTFLKNNPERWE